MHSIGAKSTAPSLQIKTPGYKSIVLNDEPNMKLKTNKLK